MEKQVCDCDGIFVKEGFGRVNQKVKKARKLGIWRVNLRFGSFHSYLKEGV